MEPILPFWFKQRQCKAEPAGDGVLRVTGPNLGVAYLLVRRADNGRYQAALRSDPAGADVAVTPAEIELPQDAWEAAFELYRDHVIV
jgi:hypothetical protein